MKTHLKPCVQCVGFWWPKNTILGNFSHLGNSCTNPLLPMTVKFGMLEQTHGTRLRAKFCLDRFIVSLFVGEKPQFLPFFGFWSDKQTDRQTKKLNVLGAPAAGEIQAQPNLAR